MNKYQLDNATAPRSVDQQQACSALFVGGCDDGKLREIPHNANSHRWRSIDNHGGEQIYRQELIGAPGKPWRVYVLESLDLVTAMSMILDAYAHRPNVSDQAQQGLGRSVDEGKESPQAPTTPQARVSKIIVGRLHNLGNYEHVRYEIAVDIPEGASAAAVMADIENVLGDLDPKEPCSDWDLQRAQEALKKPASEMDQSDLNNIPMHKRTVEKWEAWRKGQKAARAHLDALGGSVSYVDAKDTWDDDR